jgi:acetylornithine deacetylase
VPDWCEIEVDRRVIPGERPGDVVGQAEGDVHRALGSLEGVECLPPWVNMPPLSGEASCPWVARVSDAIARATGRLPKVTGVPFGTDAGPLGQAGLPCLVFGPGDIAQAHTKDEWVELDQVRMAAEAYYAIACDVGA